MFRVFFIYPSRWRKAICLVPFFFPIIVLAEPLALSAHEAKLVAKPGEHGEASTEEVQIVLDGDLVKSLTSANELLIRLPYRSEVDALEEKELYLEPSDIISPNVVRLRSDRSGNTQPDRGYQLQAYRSSRSDEAAALVITIFDDPAKKPLIRGYFDHGSKRYQIAEIGEIAESSAKIQCRKGCTALRVAGVEKRTNELTRPHGHPPDESYFNEPKISSLPQGGASPSREITPSVAAEQSEHAVSSNSCRIAEIATEADWEFFRDNGGDSATVNTEIILNLILADQIFRHQTKIMFVVTVQHTWDASSDPYVSVDNAFLALTEFWAHWEVWISPYFNYDTAHLFSGKDFNGIGGISAFWGNICGPLRYALSSLNTNDDQTVVHELGHAFGAFHDFEVGEDCDHFPYVMCYAEPQLSDFSGASLSAIEWAVMLNGSCLSSTTCWEPVAPPPRVEKVRVSQGTNRTIQITWDRPTDKAITGYTIRRASSLNGTYNVIGVSGETSFHDDLARESNNHYFYKIYARRYGTEGPASTPVSGFFSEEQTGPANFRASDGKYGEGVLIEFEPISERNGGTRKYQLYRAETSSSCATFLRTLEGTGEMEEEEFYFDNSVEPGRMYYYSVHQFLANGSLSACSSVDQGFTEARTLPAAQNLRASDGEATDRVTVRWDPVPGAFGYRVYRSTDSEAPGCSIPIVSFQTGTQYVDTNVQPARYYYYTIAAIGSRDSFGVCSQIESSFTTFDAPAQLSATDGTLLDRVIVGWQTNPMINAYYLYYSTNPEACASPVRILAASWGNIFEHFGIQPGRNYYYSMRAKSHGGIMSKCTPIEGGYVGIQPPSVFASSGSSTAQVSLTWSSVPEGWRYLIYRSTSGDCTGSPVAETFGTTATDTTAIPGVSYKYTAKAISSYGILSRCGPANSGYIKPLPPATTNATDGSYTDRVRLNWSATNGGISYELYRCTTPSSCGTVLVETVNGTQYDDLTATPGVNYFYSLRTRGANGSQSGLTPSNPGDRAMSPPSTVGASDGNYSTRVTVVWSAVLGAKSFNIYRSMTNSACTSILTTTATGTSFDDETATPGQTYYYSIKARGENNTLSACSATNPGYRATVPNPPATFWASDNSSSAHVQLNWTAAPGAVSYKLYRSNNGQACSSTLVSTVTGTIHNDTTATPGVEYYYSIRSRGPSGDLGPCSAPNSGSRKMLPPTDANATSRTHTGKVVVSWTAALGAHSYNLYRSTSNSACATPIASGVTSTSFEDTNVTPGVDYYYSLKTRGQNTSQSVCSAVVSGYARLSTSTITATNGTYSDRVKVTWTDAEAETHYTLYRSNSNTACGTVLVPSITGTTHNDYTATRGTTYYYSVKAYGQNGSFSNCSPVDSGFKN